MSRAYVALAMVGLGVAGLRYLMRKVANGAEPYSPAQNFRPTADDEGT